MFLKSNLHFHTSEDPLDLFIKYDVYKGIDKARELGYRVLALTCHNEFVYKEEHGEYAKDKGVLLIPGIEIEIEKAHVVILNCDKSAEKIKTFSDLKNYREKNKDIFVIAPHPFFGLFSLNGNLEKNINLFDAVEGSWFFLGWFNRNKKAEKVSEKNKKPYIATSDTHRIKYLNKSFSLVDSPHFTIEGVLSSIKSGRFKNIMQRLSAAELLEYVFWYCSSQMNVFVNKMFIYIRQFKFYTLLSGSLRWFKREFSFEIILTSFSLYLLLIFIF